MSPLLLKGLSALTAVSLVLVAAASLVPIPIRIWVQGMILVASLEGLAGFWSLYIALSKSNKVFYTVFAGGMFVRLVMVGLAAAVLMHWAPSVTWPLLALVGTFFVLSMVQLPFLIRKPVWIS